MKAAEDAFALNFSFPLHSFEFLGCLRFGSHPSTRLSSWQASLGSRERHLGPADPRVAFAAANLALLHAHRGSASLAEVLAKRSLALQESAASQKKGGEAKAGALAEALTLLAALLLRKGELAPAEGHLSRALELRKKALGERDPKVAGLMFALGSLHAAQQRPAQAEPLLRACAEGRQRALGEAHPATASALAALAALLAAQGRHAEAEPLLRRALAAREAAQGGEHKA
eukprot:tig00020965_g16872.t1